LVIQKSDRKAIKFRHPTVTHPQTSPNADYYSAHSAQINAQVQKPYENYYNEQQKQPQQVFGDGLTQTGYQLSDCIGQQFVSDPMLNAARQIGGQFAESKEKFCRYLARYLSAFQLKYYFAVDNGYVGKKLGILLFPFAHKDWSVCYDSSDTPVPPRLDVNAPDLYIPVMAFITYSLVCGIVLGTQGRFTPEKLGIITTNALVYLILENILLFITKYVMNISHALSFWHTLAYSSYKYVGMVLSLLAFLISGKTVYYAVLGYTSLAIVFFLLRTVRNFVLEVQNMYSHDAARKRKLYLLLFISFTQPFIMWWLTSGVTTSMPSKMDFAQLALSGMGLKELADKGQVPVLPDGDIDYEALLKMP
uniref:Protein YIF1 n=1 Tax=Syphacia muris TaxID=451379 RepID=A0A158R483_9BILA